MVAPSGPLAPGRIAWGIEQLESWQLTVRPGKHLHDRHRQLTFLAGSDQDRAADFTAAWTDPEVPLAEADEFVRDHLPLDPQARVRVRPSRSDRPEERVRTGSGSAQGLNTPGRTNVDGGSCTPASVSACAMRTRSIRLIRHCAPGRVRPWMRTTAASGPK